MIKENWLSIVACVLSIFAISLICVQPKTIEVDMFNSIVTILSLLVALLIGWQILQIINFRDEKAEFEKIKENFKMEMHLQVKSAEQSRSLLTSNLFTFFINQKKDYEVMKYGLDLVMMNLENANMVQTIISALVEYTEKGITYTYEYEKKETEILFFNYYKLIENVSSVEDLDLLRKRIVSGTIHR